MPFESFFLEAPSTGSLNNNILPMNLANVFQGVRKVHGIKGLPVKIGYTPTSIAYKMMMSIGSNFKAGVTFDGLYTVDKPQFFKSGQGSIHSVQRQRGNIFHETLV